MTSGKRMSIFDRLYANRLERGHFFSTAEPTSAPLLPRSINHANRLFNPHYEQKIQGRRMNIPQLPFQNKLPPYQNKLSHYPGNPPPFQNNLPPFQLKPQPYQNKPPPYQIKPQAHQSKPQPYEIKPPLLQSKPQPFLIKPQPFQNKSLPFQNKPQPFQNKPQPFQNKPQPFQNKPQPFQNKPQLYQSQPAPVRSTTEGIPSLFSPQPLPLFDPETIEKRRASLQSVNNKANKPSKESKDDKNQCVQNDEQKQDQNSAKKQELDSKSDLAVKQEDKDQPDQNAANEELDVDEYLQKERETKKQIDDIIKVAQALREKLDREKGMKLQALEIIRPQSDSGSQDDKEPSAKDAATPSGCSRDDQALEDLATSSGGSQDDREPASEDQAASKGGSLPDKSTKASSQPEIPRLMDLKPMASIKSNQIPSLMDLCVAPPAPPIKKLMLSRYEPGPLNVCWNCGRHGHSFLSCRFPKLRQFCFRCGRPQVDLPSCPNCNNF
ncbi:bromodomain-containing protein 4 [Copidosoma floridanum]|uniref:bromodomain-containing protein 4 n=1 Tax=Copidosoma floridanum TaxID=29053 RepID=UPI0006C9B5C7|nr:bromodomain-containing protein 4 [Copidosoma floridanum]